LATALNLAIAQSALTGRVISKRASIHERRLSDIRRECGRPPDLLEKTAIAAVIGRPVHDLWPVPKGEPVSPPEMPSWRKLAQLRKPAAVAKQADPVTVNTAIALLKNLISDASLHLSETQKFEIVATLQKFGALEPGADTVTK
jgi:hypothetical protein